MTFQKFEQIAKQHRPDAVVHQHKTYGGVPDVAVYFTRPDGTKSKVYSYRGSYAGILNRLGVNYVSTDTLKTLEMELDMAIGSNGRRNLFTGKVVDSTAEIERLTALIAEYKSDKYVHEWD